MRSVTVVGASLAGLTSARELREQGFDGTITLVGDEGHRPYDRPPLSKAFLRGDESGVALSSDDLDIRWVLGRAATGLRGTTVLLDRDEIVSDAVVLATGASACWLPGTRGVDGIHVLRSLDDAIALRGALQPGTRVTVVGAGFIGSEIASTATLLGCAVTVVEGSPTPLSRVFGAHVGSLVAGWHEAGGATLLTGTPVRDFVLESNRVRGVRLADDRILETDVVVLGIGSVPNVSWLAESGLETNGGVVTDARGATAVPGGVAVGDCASVRNASNGVVTREEHWTAAATRPSVAIETLLSGGRSTRTFSGLPYVWSDQYNARIQFAGHRGEHSVPEIVDGDPNAGPFVVLYRDAEVPVAVLAVSSPRQFGRWRRQLVDVWATT